MAILIIEQQGKRQAGTLKGRVLIGRWPNTTIQIDDRAVSRIHAWIGLQDGRYYIADATSRTGTFVNGEQLRERHMLQDGDQVRIGPATVRYRTDPVPPPELEVIDLAPRPPSELSDQQGVFKDCVCGAPLWIPRDFKGVGQCRYCGHTVRLGPPPTGPVGPPPRPPVIPPEMRQNTSATPAAPAAQPPISDDESFDALMEAELAPPAARPSPPPPPRALRSPRSAAGPAIPPPAAKAPPPVGARTAVGELQRICGVCHAPITLFDEVTNCPSCGLAFHTDCWHENQGCSAYGCAQVGALKVAEQ